MHPRLARLAEIGARSLEFQIIHRAAIVAVLVMVLISIPTAYGQNCLETITCPIGTSAMEFFIQPFLLVVGDWIYVIVWGLIGGIIYNRSHNVMLVGFIGVIIGASLLSQDLLEASAPAIPLLIVMLGMGGAMVMYGLWKNRMNNQ